VRDVERQAFEDTRSPRPKPAAPLDRDAALAQLGAESDRRLAAWNAPDTHDRMDAVLAARPDQGSAKGWPDILTATAA